MAETTMEPWSFTIVFDEDKAKKNGYGVDTLYDYVGKNVEGLGNERIAEARAFLLRPDDRQFNPSETCHHVRNHHGR